MTTAVEQPQTTLYWYDYETFGTDPKRDRPSQFAGVRTDEDLNIVGEPLVLYCRPTPDMLPQPESCLITGVTPQQTQQQGVCEAEFIARIHEEFAQPGTCVVGYNNIRFDDEVTRYTLYRNFFDPYGREWQNGNSRWDIIDMVRMTRALRPEGIEWPTYPDGRPSHKLEHITVANGINHDAAHDALSDVYATIAVARLIKECHPKLYEFVFKHRNKNKILKQLNVREQKPVVHVSAMYPVEYGCAALVVPVAPHPTNKNGIIVYDLRFDPTPLLTLSPERIRERLFTPNAELPDGVERIPLKTVHANRCPIIAPSSTLDAAAAKRLRIDLMQCKIHLDEIRQAGNLQNKLRKVFTREAFEESGDPEHALYGGFFNDRDKAEMERVRNCSPEELARLEPAFEDSRLPELFFRYRARNFPETLNGDEKARWEEYRLARLTHPEGGGGITIDEYFARINALRQEPERTPEEMRILDELVDYGRSLVPDEYIPNTAIN